MRVKLVVAVSALVLLGAACTGSGSPPPELGGAGVDDPNQSLLAESLLLGTEAGPLVVRVPDGSVLFEGPDAVASIGGAWVISATASAGSTLLDELDGATGVVSSTSSVPGTLDVRVVSESGRAVALTEPLPEGWDPAVPLPRARTTIVVADPTGARETMTFDLRGNFEPEAFSTDDGELFLIQHLPAETPSVYRVAMLDLRRGKVRPVFGPFKGPAERMPGTRLEQVLAPDATRLYTLYTSARPGYAPHDAPVPAYAAVSFVHVLSLRDGWAHCVGLPKAMWDRPASQEAMAATPDGVHLFVIDPGLGMVAIMNTETLEVRTARIDLPYAGVIKTTSAQISPDGTTLFVATAGEDGSTVSAMDAGTFEVVATWHLDGAISGLGISSDGAHVYAAVGDRVVVLDATTGGEVGEVAVPTDAPIVRLTTLTG
jgi:hypothetical protein